MLTAVGGCSYYFQPVETHRWQISQLVVTNCGSDYTFSDTY